MKYGNWTLGQTEALLNLLGGEDEATAILRGEKAIKIEEAIQKLFDKNGRRIPKDLENAVWDPDKNFYLVQPKFEDIFDYAHPLDRFREAFHLDPISTAEFADGIKELISELKANELLVNLLNGVYLPITLPQIEVQNFDYGTTLENVFLPVVKKAYEAQFPGRNFYNYRKGELANQVTIVEGSRHEILVERMKQEIVCALYFPNPLQGFSVLASREQMKDLPESLILAGGFDTSAAMVEYIDTTSRDCHTSGYDLSALYWRSPDCSLYFGAGGDKLDFDGRALLGSASGRYSSGLLFLGSD